MEQAVQLSVAVAKAGLAGVSSDERDLFRDQLLQGTDSIYVHHASTCTFDFLRYLSFCTLLTLSIPNSRMHTRDDYPVLESEFTLSVCCSQCLVIPAGLEITILGSNDFYSFRKQVEHGLTQFSASDRADVISFVFILCGRFARVFVL